jgi:hypothetical protein
MFTFDQNDLVATATTEDKTSQGMKTITPPHGSFRARLLPAHGSKFFTSGYVHTAAGEKMTLCEDPTTCPYCAKFAQTGAWQDERKIKYFSMLQFIDADADVVFAKGAPAAGEIVYVMYTKALFIKHCTLIKQLAKDPSDLKALLLDNDGLVLTFNKSGTGLKTEYDLLTTGKKYQSALSQEAYYELVNGLPPLETVLERYRPAPTTAPSWTCDREGDSEYHYELSRPECITCLEDEKCIARKA